MLLARRTLKADNQHVLGEPALLTGLPARDAQRVAFLAEEGVAAVARAEALDRQFFGEMHDEAAIRIEFTDGVQAADEDLLARDAFECGAPHARHDAHVEDDIGAVGDLDAAACEWRIDRAHAIGHDIKCAALHAAVEQRTHARMALGRREPQIVGAGVFLLRRADEGDLLDARDVARV